jgi:hypothetical protein
MIAVHLLYALRALISWLSEGHTLLSANLLRPPCQFGFQLSFRFIVVGLRARRLPKLIFEKSPVRGLACIPYLNVRNAHSEGPSRGFHLVSQDRLLSVTRPMG